MKSTIAAEKFLAPSVGVPVIDIDIGSGSGSGGVGGRGGT